MFDFLDKKFKTTNWNGILLIIIILVTLMIILNKSIIDTILMLPCIIIAITIHEFGHALVAYILGDNSTRSRISLNPFKHIEIYGLISLVVLGFGWGKPVEVNSLNYKKKYNRNLCNALVSFAGPIFNLLLAFLVILIIKILLQNSIAFYNFVLNDTFIVRNLLALPIINISLATFNLLPIPPLDGYKAFYAILPATYTKFVDRIEENQPFLFIFLLFLVPWWRILEPINICIHSLMYGI